MNYLRDFCDPFLLNIFIMSHYRRKNLFLIQKLYVNLVCCSNVGFWQEPQLSPRDCVMCRVSKYYANVAQMFVELHVKDLHYANDLQGFSRSLEWRVVTMCLSRAISLTLSLLRCKWLPVARLTPKSLSILKKKQLQLRTIDNSTSMYTHSIVNTCHTDWQIWVRKV